MYSKQKLHNSILDTRISIILISKIAHSCLPIFTFSHHIVCVYLITKNKLIIKPETFWIRVQFVAFNFRNGYKTVWFS